MNILVEQRIQPPHLVQGYVCFLRIYSGPGSSYRGTAMDLFRDGSGVRLTQYASIAAAASFALTPWIWLILVW